ncbi:peptidase C19, ubiquitin carboxyl-terminal hydrolase 2 [Gymnopus androsaceus JB14]|uniref:ubiquitinyl hydrolase 1 n=1 Tax=Gymnopus androsaceus JB14 TaxID=1447944 RepID=A0A6A4GZ85_9AGAR|nr:peptidase C19, ubiquitin carboxyl-terminal hydrolase 2 [Gymnopus androsaceus JB14]
MAKSKTLTPQEIYRAKKQQEEQERLSLLPPGLINHGNTCFMNSVLQGLIATRLLSQLIHFEPIPEQVQRHSSALLASQRSPLLTNGHQLAGIYDQKWVNSMPIGDVFIGVMYRAWEAQRLRKRESQSPRQLLATLGRKYDQYQDFAQQDAHEFLRILLDAMRMEEFDVIKKRQPPPPTDKRKVRRRTTITPANIHSSSNETQQDQSTQLMSLSDMLFGGQLTSILVCQKCKHVSQTYEDFNDLIPVSPDLPIVSPPLPPNPPASASIRPALNLEVQKSSDSDVPGSTGIRASSVPPTPKITEHEPIFSPDGNRRRSLDGLTNGTTDTVTSDDEDDPIVIEVAADGESPVKPLPSPPGLTTPDEKRIEFVDAPKVERSDKGKDKDGWARIGRRISMSVGIGKGNSKEKGKEKEKERTSRSRTRASVDMSRPSVDRARSPLNSTSESLQPEIRLSRPSLSPERPQSTPPMFLKRALTSQELVTPKSKSRPQSLSRSPTNHVASDNIPIPKLPFVQRSKSPKPPKPSKAEEDYLRAILADVNATPVSGANPFDFFANWHHLSNDDAQTSSAQPAPASSPSGSIPSPSPGSAWLAKLGQLPLAGVEECLRMFTAVEVLDGENMVGCRRCWKLANGWYEEKGKRKEEKLSRGKIREEEEEDDGDDSEEDDDNGERDSESEDAALAGGSSGKPSSAPPNPAHISSFSSPTLGLYAHENPSDAFSVFSSPPNVAGTSHSRSPSVVSEVVPDPNSQQDEPPTGSPKVPPPIPSICTTEIDLDSSVLTARPEDAGFAKTVNGATSEDSNESNESLLSVPLVGQHLESDTSASSVTDYSSDGRESDTSVSTATSALASGLSVESLAETSTTDPSTPSATSFLTNGTNGIQRSSSDAPSAPLQPSPAKKKTKAPKPVIMRPAYKRYLVATPPPILVIHLKRFQQINKNPIMSFSSGFKKLEDYVAFPEYFDLTPFLAPKKEDFGLGKGARDDVKERCMYRLYAVVVHIGNMLGGHYISYTALPDMPTQADSASPPPSPANGRRQWAYISDTVVRLTTLEEVLKAKAYICMYERI